MHVFLSYCRDNGVEVAQIRDDLLNAGEPVWWDQDILPGQDWKFEIRRAMKNAYAVVLCLSAESAARARSGIYPEAMDAIVAYRKYAPGSIFLIPVRLSECEIPLIEIDATRTLDRIQYVDLFPPQKRADGLGRLVTALRAVPRHPQATLPPNATTTTDKAAMERAVASETGAMRDVSGQWIAEVTRKGQPIYKIGFTFEVVTVRKHSQN